MAGLHRLYRHAMSPLCGRDARPSPAPTLSVSCLCRATPYAPAFTAGLVGTNLAAVGSYSRPSTLGRWPRAGPEAFSIAGWSSDLDVGSENSSFPRGRGKDAPGEENSACINGVLQYGEPVYIRLRDSVCQTRGSTRREGVCSLMGNGVFASWKDRGSLSLHA